MTASVSDPVVRKFVAAVNAGDKDAFFADVLTEDATMSDDGSERDLAAWTEKEIFSPQANGRMEVVEASDDGRSLVVDYTNDTWGTMRTRWIFTVAGDRVSRFETGRRRPEPPVRGASAETRGRETTGGCAGGDRDASPARGWETGP